MTPDNLLEHSMPSSYSSLCNFLRSLIPWIAVLIPFFIYSSISGYGFFASLITSLLLLFSTNFFLNFSKQKQVLVEEALAAHPELICCGQSQVEETEKSPNSSKESQESMILNCLANGSPDSYSESEVINQYYSSSTSEEDSDIDWPFPGNVELSTPDCSDGSISDEESLIEIALPSGQYLGWKEEAEEHTKWGFEQKGQDFSPEAIFGQRSLMELLAEINDTYDMNEEENLIEIDISMGSIKCSRFEIEA